MERPKGMSWSTFVGWYKNNKKDGIGVREAWSKYKEDNGIKTKTKTTKKEGKKKTSTEKRKRKGIRLLKDRDGDIILDIVIKERKIGEERREIIKEDISEEEWIHLKNTIKDILEDYVLDSISKIIDRPEIITIRLKEVEEDEDIKNIKKKIVRKSKEGIQSVVDDRKKIYFV